MSSISCPACNAPIHPVNVAAPFCPWCGKPRAPVGQVAQAAVAVSGGAELSIAERRDRLRAAMGRNAPSEPRQTRPFTSSPYNLCLAFEPQIGFALIGLHEPDGEKPRLRAWDLYNKRVAWEALADMQGIDDVSYEHIAVRGRNVYVDAERSMQVLDLYTGQTKWGAEFPDKLEYQSSAGPNRGLKIVDVSPPGQPGAVLAFTTDYTVCSFDRDTGRPLWRETRESTPSNAMALGESGLVWLDANPPEIMNPFSQTPVLKPVFRGGVIGHYGIAQVSNHGWLQRDGIVLFDYLANKELLFEAIDDVMSDVPMVMGHGRIFCAVEREKLFAAPNGKPTLLKEGFRIAALCMAGPTLFVLLTKEHGTRYRRVLGVDPLTLAVRFDLGELSSEPDDNRPWQMCTNEQIVAFVTSRDQSDDHCEIWGVLPTGQVLWKTYVGEWKGHYFQGGHIVVRTDNGWFVLRPNDGQITMEYRTN